MKFKERTSSNIHFISACCVVSTVVVKSVVCKAGVKLKRRILVGKWLGRKERSDDLEGAPIGVARSMMR